LLPFDTLKGIVEVLMFGKQKYGENSWQLVPEAKKRYYDAMMRHITAWWSGEKLDSESGKNHLFHAGCCLIFLIWFELNKDLNSWARNLTKEEYDAVKDKIQSENNDGVI